MASWSSSSSCRAVSSRFGGSCKEKDEEVATKGTNKQAMITRSPSEESHSPGTAERGGWSGTQGAVQRQQQLYPQLSCSQEEVTVQNELLPQHWNPTSAQHYSCKAHSQKEQNPDSLQSLGDPLHWSLERGLHVKFLPSQYQLLKAKKTKHATKGTDLLRCS